MEFHRIVGTKSGARDLPLVLDVVREIDGRHPALTELTLDTVTAF